MASEPTLETHSLFIERDTERKIRHRNKLYYRFNHWPIWIFVFFIAPGPLVFDFFERGFDQRIATWLAVVLIGYRHRWFIQDSCLAVSRGRTSFAFTEDRPNPPLSTHLLHHGLGRSDRLCHR